MYRLEHDVLRAETFRQLTGSVGWGMPPVEQVRIALEQSLHTVLATEQGRPVGMGRICGDGALSFFIKDLVVHPDRQRAGIGSAVLTELLDYIRRQLKPGWQVQVELMAAREAESWYAAFGFQRRPDDIKGAGMFLALKA